MNGAGLPASAFRAGNIPKRDWLDMKVPEAKNYQLLYDLDLAKLGPDIRYDVDNRPKIDKPVERIAYFIELQTADGAKQCLYVSMDAFTQELDKMGSRLLPLGRTFSKTWRIWMSIRIFAAWLSGRV